MPPRFTTPATQAHGGGLLAKLGDRLKKANAQHKNDEVKLPGSGSNLPGGITGIAQLTSCKFDTHKDGDNKGKYFFYAAGVVQEPETFTDKLGNVHRVKGKRTSVTEPLYDTPTRSRQTVEEHLKFIYNVWRLLGVNTSTFPDDIGEGFLESVAASLVAAKPYFEFETSQLPASKDPKYKDREPQVYHAWGARIDYTIHADPGSGVTEEASLPSLNGANGHVSNHTVATTEEVATEEPQEEINPDDLDRSDLASLLERANQFGVDADAAQTQLVAMAVKAGYDEAVVNSNDVKSWEEVVEMINNPISSDNEGMEEGAGEVEEVETPAPPPPPPPTPVAAEPKKGKTCNFRPMSADKKNRVKKAVQCEITEVDSKNKTCTLKSLVDNKVYKGVKWDVLNK